MKTLILVRHAKSDWGNPDLSDFDRPLNKRGLKDAPFMAELVASKIKTPDLIMSSPANRAITTAKYFATAFKYPIDKIEQINLIYSSGVNGIKELIASLNNDYKTVILFGHNPAVSSLAYNLSGGKVPEMPTCAVACIDFDISFWEEILNSEGDLRFYEYPKKYKS
ncbi:MAG: histidine phosphatase family protein [Candidatus Kapabacteria bacterium]|nr:histidine phosphatase family protein [Candidatus Kapabacteria bacterium]